MNEIEMSDIFHWPIPS